MWWASCSIGTQRLRSSRRRTVTPSTSNKAPRCRKGPTSERFGTERLATKRFFFDRRLKFFFTDGLLTRTPAQVRHFLFRNFLSDRHRLVRETQALGEDVQVARKPAATGSAAGNNKKRLTRCGAETLSVERSSVESRSIRGEEVSSKVVSLTNSHTPSRARSTNPCSPFSSNRTTLPPTLDTKFTLDGPLTPSSALV